MLHSVGGVRYRELIHKVTFLCSWGVLKDQVPFTVDNHVMTFVAMSCPCGYLEVMPLITMSCPCGYLEVMPLITMSCPCGYLEVVRTQIRVADVLVWIRQIGAKVFYGG